MQPAGAFFLKILVKCFRFVPFWLLFLLSDVLRFLLKHLFQYRKKVVLANLQNSFPEKTPAEINRLAARFYHHFCDVLLESIKGLTLPKAELQRRFVYRNPEIFLPLFEKNRSAILLGSHYGNWEWGVLSFPMAVRHEVAGIYKPLKNKVLDNHLNHLRKQWGLHLANMAQAGRAVVQMKNQPCIFVLIADQTPSDVNNAHWVEFLHQGTPFLPGMDKLARQTGYPVFYFEIKRVRRGFYEVVFSELCPNPMEAEAGEITKIFARKLETTIRRNPPDWLWSHRRWKRKRPPTNLPG
ncbi:MAG: lysophospholipid acyltransferase family protein [Bacteroidetes bacterium]|nr:lysophospholipid acyltransferase family protein [Bacteroidota bacterium]